MMNVICKSPYQSEITLKDGVVHVIGSLQLIKKVSELKNQFGLDPKAWPPMQTFKSNDELLINEFILKLNQNFKLAYEHEELCHCRMVPAEKVYNAIKQNCHTVEEVARTTMAGTGCGTCRSDIQSLLQQFKLS